MAMSAIEKACMDICNDNLNMHIPWYLMAAYAYYVEDNPILEDKTFDMIAKRILKHWDEIDHFHKKCLSKDMLKAGTFLGEYPSRVKGALTDVRHAYR
jgi:hypothetical protein